MEKVTGIASQRVLPPYAKTRFSTWWKKRTALRAPAEEKQGSALLFPTCLVEYQSPPVGKDLVRVMERNGIDCDVPAGQGCCGAPRSEEHTSELQSLMPHSYARFSL